MTDSLTLSSVTGYFDQDAVDMGNYGYGGVLNGESYALGPAISTNTVEQDGLSSPGADVGRREVVQTLVIALLIEVIVDGGVC